MKENPYNQLLGMMKSKAKSQIPKFIRFGVVVSPDEEPIKRIDVEGIEYKSQNDELMCTEGLTLTLGDKLLLISLDSDQKMLILCKVVDL